MRFCWVIQIPPLHDQHLRDKPAWHSSPVRQAGAYWLSSTWGQYLTVARQTCWIRYDAAQHDTFIRWCWTWYNGASHLEHSRPKKFSLVGFDVEKLNHVSILDHTAQRLWRIIENTLKPQLPHHVDHNFTILHTLLFSDTFCFFSTSAACCAANVIKRGDWLKKSRNLSLSWN